MSILKYQEDAAMGGGCERPCETERLVLIVEDEPVLRSSMARGLSKLPDLEIVVAGNVTEGRKLIGALRPSVLVLDLHLPDGSGLELLAEVTEQNLCATTIFVTAFPQRLHGDVPSRRDVLVLEKPVPIAQLRETVLGALGAMGVRSSSPSPFSLADYLQLAGFSRRTVHLEVFRNGQSIGSVWVKDGFGVHAEDAEGQGLEAFQRLLVAESTSIACRAIEGNPDVPRTLDQSCEALLLNSTRLIDESLRLEAIEAAPESSVDEGWQDLGLDNLDLGDLEPSEQAAPTPRSAGIGERIETFEDIYERGVEALLSKEYGAAYSAFVAAKELGTTVGLEANLSRLRAMGYGS